MAHVLDIVSVVDRADDLAVVWWVDPNPPSKASEQCGAWVLPADDPRVGDLVAGRWLLATPAGAAAVRQLGAEPRAVVDVRATVTAVTDEISRLHGLFLTEVAKPGKQTMTEPTWPVVGAPIDLARPPQADAAEPAACTALGVARWTARLSRTWHALEEERSRRPYLREAGTSAHRPVPLRAREDAAWA